jgi:uncharacterized SAM-binding protein YcdF (DUF218 family)
MAFVVIVTLFVGVTARLFIWPAYDAPEHANVIVSLAGSPNRLAKALALARAGYASEIVSSVVPGQGEPCVKSRPGIRIVCFHPVPATTRGEARYVGRLAAKRGWIRVMIITGKSQATRARMLFERCYAGRLIVVPVPNSTPGVWHNISYEWGATLKALATPGC